MALHMRRDGPLPGGEQPCPVTVQSLFGYRLRFNTANPPRSSKESEAGSGTYSIM